MWKNKQVATLQQERRGHGTYIHAYIHTNMHIYTEEGLLTVRKCRFGSRQCSVKTNARQYTSLCSTCLSLLVSNSSRFSSSTGHRSWLLIYYSSSSVIEHVFKHTKIPLKCAKWNHSCVHGSKTWYPTCTRFRAPIWYPEMQLDSTQGVVQFACIYTRVTEIMRDGSVTRINTCLGGLHQECTRAGILIASYPVLMPQIQ